MRTDWTILPFPCALTPASRALRKDLRKTLRDSGSLVILDFSDCDSLNHEDFELLLECVAEVSGRDTELLFVAGSAANRVLLEVTRISSLVPVFNSVQEALSYPQLEAEKNAEDQHASESENAWRT